MAEVNTDHSLPGPLPWQSSLLKQVMQQHAQHRLHHAWLLQGAQGSGKRRFAHALAAARLCRERDAAGYPCGRCKSCDLIRAGSHPDLLEVLPEEGRTALKVDQIRAMGSFVSRTASTADSARIVILDPAEGLGQGAANALLKNLEEPPGDALFLLIAHVPGAVLPTIRSRCQPMPMPEPDRDGARSWLLTQVDDEEQVDAALQLAPGRPLEGLRLIRQKVPVLFAFLEEKTPALLRDDASLADLLTGCQDSEARQVLGWLLHDLYRRAASRATSGTPLQPASGEPGALFTGYRRLLEVDRQLAGTANPNRQLTLESAFILWKRVVSQCH